ncbi:von Hippel-Lindau disease tumor suppressor [Bombus vosnesenskii]|uniref:von Hippel-Lindau disease tumor suppressor n=1 Tax=Bombus vosnesenskii TaxID=207650 RepID=A0A6J3K419_9HYME|nr:von Hippel-Lindau disease tumor suppressor [Bombus vosnesenskii]XP_033347246.1 von Hippel-Lindau disease tumor suppressor [Bombus vosnesenskii]XP_033347247.1 von Hippel-Lindau disease tumor suppressor [Bombus vosnesenskii]
MGESQEQQQPLLRSINNVYVSLVRFINKTMHNVILYWIDYQGRAISYGVLSPGDCLDIDTFVTHPWIFVDQETRDRYTVNQKEVFFPEPSPLLLVRQECRNPIRVALHPHRRRERTDVFITLPIYTLRELCLRAIRRLLTHDEQAFQLDIPRSLQYELAIMLLKNEEISNARNS